jgi:hypothetical protein
MAISTEQNLIFNGLIALIAKSYICLSNFLSLTISGIPPKPKLCFQET